MISNPGESGFFEKSCKQSGVESQPDTAGIYRRFRVRQVNSPDVNESRLSGVFSLGDETIAEVPLQE